LHHCRAAEQRDAPHKVGSLLAQPPLHLISVFDGQSAWRQGVEMAAKNASSAGSRTGAGLHMETFRDGTLAGVGKRSAGQKSGRWKYYFRNGELKAAGNYLNGQLEGLWRWHREGGGLLQVGRFKDGKQVGLWKRYHASGELCDIGKYLAGTKAGEWRYYDKQGKLRRTEQHTSRMQRASRRTLSKAVVASRRTRG
jgi:MORN repeat variant